MTDSPTITAKWEDLDADGDGVITKAEWEAVAQAQASTGGAESDMPATREHDKTAALAQRPKSMMMSKGHPSRVRPFAPDLLPVCPPSFAWPGGAKRCQPSTTFSFKGTAPATVGKRGARLDSALQVEGL